MGRDNIREVGRVEGESREKMKSGEKVDRHLRESRQKSQWESGVGEKVGEK